MVSLGMASSWTFVSRVHTPYERFNYEAGAEEEPGVFAAIDGGQKGELVSALGGRTALFDLIVRTADTP